MKTMPQGSTRLIGGTEQTNPIRLAHPVEEPPESAGHPPIRCSDYPPPFGPSPPDSDSLRVLRSISSASPPTRHSFGLVSLSLLLLPYGRFLSLSRLITRLLFMSMRLLRPGRLAVLVVLIILVVMLTLSMYQRRTEAGPPPGIPLSGQQ